VSDHFPPGSVIRTVNIEPALFFGAGRALLLQLAHPAVAQGVQDHSEFQRNPFKRLQGTLEATYAVVFGSEELARGVGWRIQRIHDFVTGPGYSANDPSNLLWVHATLADTALRCYEDLVGPLSPADAETYYQEMKEVAAAFGVGPEHQPETLEAFRRYMADTVASIEVTDVGKELAGFILDPRLPLRLDVPFTPLLRLQRLFTLGSLPPEVRDSSTSRGDRGTRLATTGRGGGCGRFSAPRPGPCAPRATGPVGRSCSGGPAATFASSRRSSRPAPIGRPPPRSRYRWVPVAGHPATRGQSGIVRWA